MKIRPKYGPARDFARLISEGVGRVNATAEPLRGPQKAVKNPHKPVMAAPFLRRSYI
jgi:hypothetical protein